jgi:hypothetical protein
MAWFVFDSKYAREARAFNAGRQIEALQSQFPTPVTPSASYPIQVYSHCHFNKNFKPQGEI